MKTASDGLMRKSFPVFDCDAHIHEPLEIWTTYVEPEYLERVRRTYWRDEEHTILNGRTEVLGGNDQDFPAYNPICVGGPGMNKKAMRKLQRMSLTPEQHEYVKHRGAYDPHARVKDMDLMGIDQVLIIPTMQVAHIPYAEDAEGAYGFCRAYNNWLDDFCRAVPERLFGAGVLPIQNPVNCAAELNRIAEKGFRVALVRPIDARGNYPNRIFHTNFRKSGFPALTMDRVFKTFEETGLVLGMHTFPAIPSEPSSTVVSPAEFVSESSEGTGRRVDSQTLGFVFEAMTWLSQVLLSGFVDRYPKLKMAIFESNATWLPLLLGRCDRLFKLYRNERRFEADRLPSEAFYQQCLIAFESDEAPVFRQWDRFENVGIWSSDAYHQDAADAWSAMREMGKVEVPEAVQAKLLGANARRAYGIEGKLFATEEPASVPRPAWFPQGADLEQWWETEANPRRWGPRATTGMARTTAY